MMITICILALMGMVISFLDHLDKGKIDVNLLFPTILTVAVWEMNLTLAIITISITIVIGIIGAFDN